MHKKNVPTPVWNIFIYTILFPIEQTSWFKKNVFFFLYSWRKLSFLAQHPLHNILIGFTLTVFAWTHNKRGCSMAAALGIVKWGFGSPRSSMWLHRSIHICALPGSNSSTFSLCTKWNGTCLSPLQLWYAICVMCIAICIGIFQIDYGCSMNLQGTWLHSTAECISPCFSNLTAVLTRSDRGQYSSFKHIPWLLFKKKISPSIKVQIPFHISHHIQLICLPFQNDNLTISTGVGLFKLVLQNVRMWKKL